MRFDFTSRLPVLSRLSELFAAEARRVPGLADASFHHVGAARLPKPKGGAWDPRLHWEAIRSDGERLFFPADGLDDLLEGFDGGGWAPSHFCGGAILLLGGGAGPPPDFLLAKAPGWNVSDGGPGDSLSLDLDRMDKAAVGSLLSILDEGFGAVFSAPEGASAHERLEAASTAAALHPELRAWIRRLAERGLGAAAWRFPGFAAFSAWDGVRTGRLDWTTI